MDKKEQRVLLKNDIVDRMAILTGGTKKDAETFLNAYHAVLTNAINNGYRVKDVGYFDIYVSNIPEGKAFKPNRNGGGELIARPASKRVVVKSGTMLRKYTNPLQNIGEEDK